MVFGYGAAFSSGAFHAPGFTIEARYDRPVRVTWINQLVDGNGSFLPHLFTADPTLHWANPPASVSGRDSHSTFTSTPPPYTGPVPGVTHLHGAHVLQPLHLVHVDSVSPPTPRRAGSRMPRPLPIHRPYSLVYTVSVEKRLVAAGLRWV